MKRTKALMLVLLAPALLFAQDKPNTLTEKEVQVGWISLFDGETAFGWKLEGEAKVEMGLLRLGGDKPASAQTTTHFADGETMFECRWKGKEKPTISLRGKTVPPLSLAVWSAGKWSTLTFKAEKLMNFLTVQGNGVVSSSHFGGRSFSGTLGSLGFAVPAGTTLEVRSVKYRPLAMQSLFNGKDLTGWKVFEGKGKKSKFTVTKDALLNVKDGPGDIQSEQLYDDFVLQVEGRTNGKHLNSGIFFRAIPAKYQQGYEAQIRHQFTEKPTQKYMIEEYDPKTHKLTGKKEVMSTAVDYGTGSIYRRVPARKGVAKDNEWFVMTLIARERHMATWVNGIQVADWTDNRPDNENGRNGYRATAGAISIQGHDPTTDLDFRQIRIATLPRVKNLQWLSDEEFGASYCRGEPLPAAARSGA